MVNEKFLIDSNSFITPYRFYYAFDLIPTFWEELSKHIGAGTVILLDKVKAEIDKGHDNLTNWMNNQSGIIIYSHAEAEIINQYSLIIRYISDCNFYSIGALNEWSKDSVADPWLIATAKVKGYTIITFEGFSGKLNEKQPSSHPRIPDVAKKFDVKTADLYYMMRQLGIKI